MYLSARYMFGHWDKNWESYIKWVGLDYLDEVRSLDTTLNVYPAEWGAIECTPTTFSTASGFLPAIDPVKQYYQLAIPVGQEEAPSWLTYSKFLGYDLVDTSWTSSVLNCGRWRGELREIAKRVNQFGLLGYFDAQQSRIVLPRVWRNDPHANVEIFALYDVTGVKMDSSSALHAGEEKGKEAER